MRTPPTGANVQLTGRAHVQVESSIVPFEPDKRYQLLAYLAYAGDWVGRERLAFLFWPDTHSSNARQNLRGLLQRVRNLPWGPGVEASATRARWAVSTDVAALHRALDDGGVDEALEAYHGPLLEGLEADDEGEFGEWLRMEREALYSAWRGAILANVRRSEDAEAARGLTMLRRVLDVDPLDEDAVRLALEVSARAGEPEQGLRWYRDFQGRLGEALGLEPTSATLALVEAVEQRVVERAATLARRTGPGDSPDVPSITPRSALPQERTSFVGRQRELADVVERLRRPDCRLLTIVGAGGIGKTRVALRAAAERAADLPDGVCYVELETWESPESVPAAIADALGVPLQAGQAPFAQVTQQLRGGQLLLLLDNFEHLVDGAMWVASLLEACPGLQVLVTSRQRLSLAEEWLYPLDGLAYPPPRPSPGDDVEGALATAANYGAVLLFVERAARVRPGFRMREEDLPDVVEICRITKGFPLAIELAAAWARALPVRDIAVGIAKGLELLVTDARDIKDRHRSIRLTFEHSWGLLSASEQAAARRLAVFRAPIRRAGAAYVAEAGNAVLAALVDKSILRLNERDRFERHPLLQRYLLEKAQAETREYEATIRRHRAYYLRFLRDRTDRARGADPGPALSEIDGELADILYAADLARARGDDQTLVAFMRLLALDTGYLQARGYGPQSFTLLQAAAAAAPSVAAEEAPYDLMGRLGDALQRHIGDRAAAQAAYLDARRLARDRGDKAREAVFLGLCGVGALHLGQDDVDDLLVEALALAQASSDDLACATVLEQTGYAMAMRRRWPEASDLFRRSLAYLDAVEAGQRIEPYDINHQRFFAMLNLGETELHSDRFEVALDLRRQALSIADASHNPIWSAHALQEMGEMYESVGDRHRAQAFLTRAFRLYRDNHVAAYVERLEAYMRDHGLSLVEAEPETDGASQRT